MTDFFKLNERYNASKMYKDRWLALYKDLYFYVIPDRDAFNVKWNYRDDGKPVTAMVWDNTAVLGAYQRANDLHSLLLPKDRIWGKMVMDPQIYSPQTIEQSKETLDEINDRVFFYINKSNLSRIVSSSNLDLVGGTGGIWVESIDDVTPLYFRSIPAVALYIEYSTDDTLNTAWYQCKFTGRQVLDTFPNYRGKIVDKLEGNPNDIYIVVYGQIKMSDNKFYIYAVLEDDPFHPLFEVDRSYPQMIIYRDRVRPGEADGRGIGIDLLPAIRDLNRIVEYSRKNMAFKAYPPMFYDSDAYFNPYAVRQWAGAMIMRKPQSRNPIEAMQMPEYPDVIEHIRDIRDFIRVGFQVDPLGEIQSPVRSATEVSIRENRAQRTASTDISRLINELPAQVYEVSAKILNERRMLTRDRGNIQNFDTKRLTFWFTSPLTDLQNQDELNHFITNMQIKQQFFGQGTAMATVDLEKANQFLTDKLNLKNNLFVSGEKLKQILQFMGQQAAQNAQLPTPATAATPVKFPEQPQVQI